MKTDNNKIFNPLNGTELLFDLELVKYSQKLLKKSNPFPLEVFPVEIQEIVSESKEKLKFTIDYLASSMLFVASIAIGNSVTLKIQNSWDQISSLFIAIIGKAGANKSHPLNFALKPLLDLGFQAYSEFEKEVTEYNRIMDLTKKERREEGLDEPIKPVLKKYLISDITSEALMDIHKGNLRGLGLYMDELVAWIKNLTRYKNGGGDQELWNSLWSGQTAFVDRKNSGSTMIKRPFVSVCGTIQPEVLKELAKNDRGNNGFLYRMLMVMPIGVKKEAWSKHELNQKYIDSWKIIIENLLNIKMKYDEYGVPISNSLLFSEEARSFLDKWQALNTKAVNDANEKDLVGFYIKLESMNIRFCLILQVLQYVTGEDENFEVSLDSVIGAIKLTEYFRTNAARASELIINKCPLDDLPKNKLEFYENLSDPFKTKQAIELGKSFSLEERAVKRMLNEKSLFQRIGHGNYEKLL